MNRACTEFDWQKEKNAVALFTNRTKNIAVRSREKSILMLHRKPEKERNDGFKMLGKLDLHGKIFK